MAGDEQGFAAGMNNAFMSLANIVGPTVAGLLFDVNVEIPYIFGVVVLVLSFWRQSAGGGSSRRAQFLKSIREPAHMPAFYGEMLKSSNMPARLYILRLPRGRDFSQPKQHLNSERESQAQGRVRIFQAFPEQFLAFFKPVDDGVSVDVQALGRFRNLTVRFQIDGQCLQEPWVILRQAGKLMQRMRVKCLQIISRNHAQKL